VQVRGTDGIFGTHKLQWPPSQKARIHLRAIPHANPYVLLPQSDPEDSQMCGTAISRSRRLIAQVIEITLLNCAENESG
jgi:hypothetical protein